MLFLCSCPITVVVLLGSSYRQWRFFCWPFASIQCCTRRVYMNPLHLMGLELMLKNYSGPLWSPSPQLRNIVTNPYFVCIQELWKALAGILSSWDSFQLECNFQPLIFTWLWSEGYIWPQGSVSIVHSQLTVAVTSWRLVHSYPPRLTVPPRCNKGFVVRGGTAIVNLWESRYSGRMVNPCSKIQSYL